MDVDPPPPYLIYPSRRRGKAREGLARHPGWLHHQACLAANQPCVQVRTYRTRCTVALDLTTVHRALVERHGTDGRDPGPLDAVVVAALKMGGREVYSGGVAVHVYQMPITAAEDLVQLLLALAADPSATRPRYTYGNADPDDVFDEARYECRAL